MSIHNWKAVAFCTFIIIVIGMIVVALIISIIGSLFGTTAEVRRVA